MGHRRSSDNDRVASNGRAPVKYIPSYHMDAGYLQKRMSMYRRKIAAETKPEAPSGTHQDS